MCRQAVWQTLISLLLASSNIDDPTNHSTEASSDSGYLQMAYWQVRNSARFGIMGAKNQWIFKQKSSADRPVIIHNFVVQIELVLKSRASAAFYGYPEEYFFVIFAQLFQALHTTLANANAISRRRIHSDLLRFVCRIEVISPRAVLDAHRDHLSCITKHFETHAKTNYSTITLIPTEF